MPFEFKQLKLPGVVLVKPKVFLDHRGFFLEAYKWSDFAANGIAEKFVQDNHSRSSKGVLRGMHYQRGAAAQGKLVRCLSGAILDVGVDVRPASATFGQWVSAELTDANSQMLYLPPGFAHGFLVLSATADILYKSTAEYSPSQEGGVRWDDPDIGIEWGEEHPQLLPRDAALPRLKDASF